MLTLTAPTARPARRLRRRQWSGWGLHSLGAFATRRFVQTPFADPQGLKGLFGPLTRAPMHRLVQVSMRVPGWPEMARPLRVAFLSDFHTGSHTGDVQRFADIVVEVNRLRPDLVCLGGDYVNCMAFGGGRVPPETTAEILAGLVAPLGLFAVLGNHDWEYDGKAVWTALNAVGIQVLENEFAPVTFEGTRIFIVGIGDNRTRDPDVQRTLMHVPIGEPALVLAHDPASFTDLPPGPYVMLSGHTHGGQIQLPLVGPLINMSEAPRTWTYGHIESNGRQLYVTSGLGTSGLPIRIGIPPEIVLVEIAALSRSGMCSWSANDPEAAAA